MCPCLLCADLMSWSVDASKSKDGKDKWRYWLLSTIVRQPRPSCNGSPSNTVILTHIGSQSVFFFLLLAERWSRFAFIFGRALCRIAGSFGLHPEGRNFLRSQANYLSVSTSLRFKFSLLFDPSSNPYKNHCFIASAHCSCQEFPLSNSLLVNPTP